MTTPTQKLNDKGLTHLLLVIIFVVVIVAIGGIAYRVDHYKHPSVSSQAGTDTSSSSKVSPAQIIASIEANPPITISVLKTYDNNTPSDPHVHYMEYKLDQQKPQILFTVTNYLVFSLATTDTQPKATVAVIGQDLAQWNFTKATSQPLFDISNAYTDYAIYSNGNEACEVQDTSAIVGLECATFTEIQQAYNRFSPLLAAYAKAPDVQPYDLVMDPAADFGGVYTAQSGRVKGAVIELISSTRYLNPVFIATTGTDWQYVTTLPTTQEPLTQTECAPIKQHDSNGVLLQLEPDCKKF